MIWRTGLVAVLLIFSMAFDLRSALASPEFSDEISSFDVVFRGVFRPITDRFRDLQKLYAFRTNPDGQAVLLNRSGNEVYRMHLRSIVNGDRTSRISELRLNDAQGIVVFGVRVKNTGQNLAPVPLEQLRDGELPLFPDENSHSSDFTITIMDYPDFRMKLMTDGSTPDSTIGVLDVRIYLSDAAAVHYRERRTATSRHLAYEILEPFGSAGRVRIEARKIQTPDMLVGTEELLVDGRAVGMSTYQDAIDQSVLYLTMKLRRGYESFLRFYMLQQQ